MTCRRFTVTGRVQGVWFRDSTRQQAERRQITGYARNMPDGTVDVVACGDSDAVEELFDWLHHGPRLASVDSVIEREAPDGDYSSFAIG